VRPSHQILLAIAAIFIAVALVPALMPAIVPALFPAAVGPPPVLPPAEANELVVMIRPGPVVYFPGPDGTLVGFDADLAQRFAAEQKLPVRFVVAESSAQMTAAIARGQAHIGAGGLLRPRVAPRNLIPDIKPAASQISAGPDGGSAVKVLWSAGFYTVEPQLIYNVDSYKPATWHDLDGETVAYLEGAGLDPDIAALAAAHPAVRFHGLDLPSSAGLFAQVSDGTIGYAIVGSLAASAARNVYLDYEVAFPAGARRDVAWIVPPRFSQLLSDLDRFLARMKRDGFIDRLAERYIPDARAFQRVDASAFQESIRTALSQWKPMFRDVQERTDIEWRLLAAIAYQESKWDPFAESETGVRGFMQITEDTARRLGIKDLLDPRQNVLGAARYLRDLKSKLPARIAEPDRTWLALAAFNIGLGHLEDARVLAQKQKLNPDLWSDVKKVLPLLALPEYHADARNGYARGGMPVAFVDRVRSYYDILLAQQPALQPRLRMLSDAETNPQAGR
jgi:membrane-bound lytic murein transglycosylase F